jgi:hypothetical protein
MAQAQAVLKEPKLTAVNDVDGTGPAATDDRPDYGYGKDAPQPPKVKNVEEPKKKKGARFFSAMIVALAVVGGGYFYLKTHGLPSGKGKSAAVVAPGTLLPGPLETSVPASATPTRSEVSDATALPPPSAEVAANTAGPSATQNTAPSASVPAVPVDMAQNFASIKVLETRLEALSRQFVTLADDVNTVIAGHAQSKEQLAQLTERARSAPAPVVAAARPATPMYQVARAAAPKPVPRPPVNAVGGVTNVVSVDMWNGTPSVVISEGDSIRFLSPGDVTAQGLKVKRADPVSQQVTFGMPSGEEIIARVDAGKQQ